MQHWHAPHCMNLITQENNILLVHITKQVRVKDCDTEASYRYKNVTVCERCRQNGPNEYLKASASAEDSKLACDPPASSPPALSCLSSRDPKPFHVRSLFCAPSVLSCACVHSLTNLLTIFASDPSLIPPVLPWSCQPSVLPVPRPLRHVSGEQRWRLWGRGGRFFTCSVWVQVHGCTVWPVFVRVSVRSEPPACSVGRKSLTAHRYDIVVWEASLI